MKIAILTFDGFNELDSLIAFGILNRIDKPGWQVQIAGPSPVLESMNGLKTERHCSLSEANNADAVLVGSGMKTRDVVANPELMDQLRLDPERQLIAAQCSGALVLAKLGLLAQIPACTDLTTRPWAEAAGVEVLEQPLFAQGNIATAGGCLASQYLAVWMLARLEGISTAEAALHYVAPVGEKEITVARTRELISPYLPSDCLAR